MPRQQKLKVYRTPIGFHDAYVAAPSQKAALTAWGADVDLFARGVAETVSDEALTREPLARPGEVVRRSRGSAAEQLAALPPDPPRAKREAGDGSAGRSKPARSSAARSSAARPARARPAPPPPAPRPSRAALDAAEQRLDALAAQQSREEDALARRERALARERRVLARAHARARSEAEAALDEARAAHAAALSTWRAGR